MRRESTPEFCKRLDAALVASHSEFELVARVNVDDYSQACGEDRVEGTVDVAEVSGVKNRWIGRVGKQRRGFDRKAHVIKTHRLYQRDVLRSRMNVEMR